MTSQLLTFEVPGPVVPKERPRFAKHAYTPKRTRDYERHVQVTAMVALEEWRVGGRRWNGALRFALDVKVYMPDKRKRDLDNCFKSISDALNKLLYNDDEQLDELHVFRYLDIEHPRVVISITSLT
jgi:Holliday junction resolvase RusA-like endonuclease